MHRCYSQPRKIGICLCGDNHCHSYTSTRIKDHSDPIPFGCAVNHHHHHEWRGSIPLQGAWVWWIFNLWPKVLAKVDFSGERVRELLPNRNRYDWLKAWVKHRGCISATSDESGGSRCRIPAYTKMKTPDLTKIDRRGGGSLGKKQDEPVFTGKTPERLWPKFSYFCFKLTRANVVLDTGD